MDMSSLNKTGYENASYFNPQVSENDMRVVRKPSFEECQVRVETYRRDNYQNGIEAIAAVNSLQNRIDELALRNIRRNEGEVQLSDLQMTIDREFLDLAYDYATRMEFSAQEGPDGEPSRLERYITSGGYSKIRHMLPREGRTWADFIWDDIEEVIWATQEVARVEETIKKTQAFLNEVSERIDQNEYTSVEEREDDIMLYNQYQASINILPLAPNYIDALEAGIPAAKRLCKQICPVTHTENNQGVIDTRINVFSFLGLDGDGNNTPEEYEKNEPVDTYQARESLRQLLLKRISRALSRKK